MSVYSYSIVKILKSGEAKKVGRSLGQVIWYCIRCKLHTKHDQHMDEDGNGHHFCAECGTHN